MGCVVYFTHKLLERAFAACPDPSHHECYRYMQTNQRATRRDVTVLVAWWRRANDTVLCRSDHQSYYAESDAEASALAIIG